MNTLEEFDAFAAKHSKTFFNFEEGRYKRVWETRLRELNFKLAWHKPSQDIYELVWQLEQECGNPEIEFFKGGHTTVTGLDIAGFYNPLLNKVTISTEDLINGKVVTSEMSHGKQFNDNQTGSWFHAAHDMVVTLVNTEKPTTESLNEAYRKLYDQRGTYEHQAHSEIAPVLAKKYPIMKNLGFDDEGKQITQR